MITIITIGVLFFILCSVCLIVRSTSQQEKLKIDRLCRKACLECSACDFYSWWYAKGMYSIALSECDVVDTRNY